jgi:hypothetical protein
VRQRHGIQAIRHSGQHATASRRGGRGDLDLGDANLADNAIVASIALENQYSLKGLGNPAPDAAVPATTRTSGST